VEKITDKRKKPGGKIETTGKGWTIGGGGVKGGFWSKGMQLKDNQGSQKQHL